jgi:hypothetical protein
LSAWAKEASARIENLPSNDQGFSELETIIRKSETDLKKVWPSEQRALLRLAERAFLTQALKKAADQTGKGIEGIKVISGLRAEHQKIIESLPADDQKLMADQLV